MQKFPCTLIKGEFCPIVGPSFDGPDLLVRLLEELPLGPRVTLIEQRGRERNHGERLRTTVGPLV